MKRGERKRGRQEKGRSKKGKTWEGRKGDETEEEGKGNEAPQLLVFSISWQNFRPLDERGSHEEKGKEGNHHKKRYFTAIGQ